MLNGRDLDGRRPAERRDLLGEPAGVVELREGERDSSLRRARGTGSRRACRRGGCRRAPSAAGGAARRSAPRSRRRPPSGPSCSRSRPDRYQERRAAPRPSRDWERARCGKERDRSRDEGRTTHGRRAVDPRREADPVPERGLRQGEGARDRARRRTSRWPTRAAVQEAAAGAPQARPRRMAEGLERRIKPLGGKAEAVSLPARAGSSQAASADLGGDEGGGRGEGPAARAARHRRAGEAAQERQGRATPSEYEEIGNYTAIEALAVALGTTRRPTRARFAARRSAWRLPRKADPDMTRWS